MNSATAALFVCGTDTDVGKTIVSAWLTLHWQASYWKPIQSGLEHGSDSQRIAQLTNAYCYPEGWRFQAALSPHQAALLEGTHIDLQNLEAPILTNNREKTSISRKENSATRLVIEGAGGLLTPLNRSQSIADLITYLDVPVIVVARSSLGTINHTCLTIEAVRARHLHLLGVIMVGDINHSNRAAIEHYGKTSVLAELPWLPAVNRESLASIAPPPALFHCLNRLVNPTL